MEKVQGFGGFFFRAEDPAGLAEWYRDHLGINPAPTNMDMAPCVTESGVTVFSPCDLMLVETTGWPACRSFESASPIGRRPNSVGLGIQAMPVVGWGWERPGWVWSPVFPAF